jgi:hypothetical protein
MVFEAHASDDPMDVKDHADLREHADLRDHADLREYARRKGRQHAAAAGQYTAAAAAAAQHASATAAQYASAAQYAEATAAQQHASATMVPAGTEPQQMTYGEYVIHCRQYAKAAQDVATGMGSITEDVRSPAIKALLLVAQERLSYLAVQRDTQLAQIAARKKGTAETLGQVAAMRTETALTCFQTVRDTWQDRVGPALLAAPECMAHAVWHALVRDIAATDPHVHPEDYVADVRVAVTEARRQAEAAAGEMSAKAGGVSPQLQHALTVAEDLESVCAKYLDATTSWHAIATEAEQTVVELTADACTHTCQQEFFRRSTQVLETCRSMIRTTLAQHHDTSAMLAGDQIRISPQHARAAYEALRARAAFELAELEMSVHGLETPWHSTLPASVTPQYHPPTSRP